MPSHHFDELFKKQIPDDLLEAKELLCLLTVAKKADLFPRYADDVTQAGVPNELNSLKVQCDYKKSGTGIFIDKSTVITAQHIVDLNNRPQVNIYCAKKMYKYRGCTTENADFAELTTQSNHSSNAFSAVRLYQGAKPALQTKVYAIGFPYCCEQPRYFEGRITAHNPTTVEASMPAVVGCSGSPVFVEQGNLGLFILGVVSFGPENERDVFDKSKTHKCIITPNGQVR